MEAQSRSHSSVAIIDQTVSPPAQNSYVEALTPSLTIFGDRAFREVIKVKWSDKAGPLIWQSCCPFKKSRKHQKSLFLSETTEESYGGIE